MGDYTQEVAGLVGEGFTLDELRDYFASGGAGHDLNPRERLAFLTQLMLNPQVYNYRSTTAFANLQGIFWGVADFAGSEAGMTSFDASLSQGIAEYINKSTPAPTSEYLSALLNGTAEPAAYANFINSVISSSDPFVEDGAYMSGNASGGMMHATFIAGALSLCPPEQIDEVITALFNLNAGDFRDGTLGYGDTNHYLDDVASAIEQLVASDDQDNIQRAAEIYRVYGEFVTAQQVNPLNTYFANRNVIDTLLEQPDVSDNAPTIPEAPANPDMEAIFGDGSPENYGLVQRLLDSKNPDGSVNIESIQGILAAGGLEAILAAASVNPNILYQIYRTLPGGVVGQLNLAISQSDLCNENFKNASVGYSMALFGDSSGTLPDVLSYQTFTPEYLLFQARRMQTPEGAALVNPELFAQEIERALTQENNPIQPTQFASIYAAMNTGDASAPTPQQVSLITTLSERFPAGGTPDLRATKFLPALRGLSIAELEALMAADGIDGALDAEIQAAISELQAILNANNDSLKVRDRFTDAAVGIAESLDSDPLDGIIDFLESINVFASLLGWDLTPYINTMKQSQINTARRELLDELNVTPPPEALDGMSAAQILSGTAAYLVDAETSPISEPLRTALSGATVSIVRTALKSGSEQGAAVGASYELVLTGVPNDLSPEGLAAIEAIAGFPRLTAEDGTQETDEAYITRLNTHLATNPLTIHPITGTDVTDAANLIAQDTNYFGSPPTPLDTNPVPPLTPPEIDGGTGAPAESADGYNVSTLTTTGGEVLHFAARSETGEVGASELLEGEYSIPALQYGSPAFIASIITEQTLGILLSTNRALVEEILGDDYLEPILADTATVDALKAAILDPNNSDEFQKLLDNPALNFVLMTAGLSEQSFGGVERHSQPSQNMALSVLLTAMDRFGNGIYNGEITLDIEDFIGAEAVAGLTGQLQPLQALTMTFTPQQFAQFLGMAQDDGTLYKGIEKTQIWSNAAGVEMVIYTDDAGVQQVYSITIPSSATPPGESITIRADEIAPNAQGVTDQIEAEPEGWPPLENVEAEAAPAPPFPGAVPGTHFERSTP
jgi:hypothetical protein